MNDLITIVGHLILFVALLVSWLVKVTTEHPRRLKSRPLGTLGECSIWCTHLGANCRCRQRHFNTPTKNCFEHGCTDDCPVERNYRCRN